MIAVTRRRRNPQRGSAMMVTMIIIGALLAGAAVLVSIQLASNRSTDLTRSGTSALYCAEAGLAAARPIVANSYAEWKASLLDSGVGVFTEPAWLGPAAIDHDLDTVGGPNIDFQLYIVDNDDEPTSDRTVDTDLSVFIVSQCLKYADTPVEVRELVVYNGGTKPYDAQSGGGTSVNNVTTEAP